MFISICNEILGLTPEQVLDSDFVLLTAVLRERNFTINQRNKESLGNDKESHEDEGEYIEIPDFNTGKSKRVKKVKTI